MVHKERLKGYWHWRRNQAFPYRIRLKLPLPRPLTFMISPVQARKNSLGRAIGLNIADYRAMSN